MTERQRKYISPRMRKTVYERDNRRCFYCGETVFEGCGPKHPKGAVVDHLIPFSKGGADEFWNYVTACRSCNSQKRGLTLDEFRAMRKERLLGLIDVFLKYGQSDIGSFDRLACSIINLGMVEAARSDSFKMVFYGEEIRRQAARD
jgi:hypothetical protein